MRPRHAYIPRLKGIRLWYERYTFMVCKKVKGIRLWYERYTFMVCKKVKGIRLWYADLALKVYVYGMSVRIVDKCMYFSRFHKTQKQTIFR